MPRFFRRVAEGVFDLDDLRTRTRALAEWVRIACERYAIDPSRLVACLDLDWRPAFRVNALPTYKAHRVPGEPETAPAGNDPPEACPFTRTVMAPPLRLLGQ